MQSMIKGQSDLINIMAAVSVQNCKYIIIIIIQSLEGQKTDRALYLF